MTKPKQRNRKASTRTRQRVQRVRRNVKKQKDGFWFPTPLASILAVATVLCLGYLWLCGSNESLSTDIRKLEYELDLASKATNNEKYKWHVAVTPNTLEAKIKEFGIDMAFPSSANIVAGGPVDRWVPQYDEAYTEEYKMAEAKRP